MNVLKATNKVEFFSNIHTVRRSRIQWVQWVIATHKDYVKIGEAGRFKKRELSKDYTEEFNIKLCTSQDLDRRFFFLALLWISDCMNP